MALAELQLPYAPDQMSAITRRLLPAVENNRVSAETGNIRFARRDSDHRNKAQTFRIFRSEHISGLATGLFSIPEGMAYAQLAGVNPIYGMYSGIVAAIVSSPLTGQS